MCPHPIPASLAAALASLVLAGSGAAAQTASPPVSKAHAPTPLEGVTVAVSRTPPTVVETFPAAGSTVDPGVTVLKVTFDQHMDPEAWRYAKGDAGAYPDCLAKPRLLADGRTFVLLCTTLSDRAYSVLINQADADTGFTGVGHRMATPFELNFTTAKGHPVSSLPEALTVAGLHDDEGPVESAEPAK
ncbi:MAG TPA: Ig-like domain-containing protein [Caulobacteraceae bacterium]|jgi:hypothetical protein|nr:Ig-like domain-containing protein [Caulobacteraceae bacterium]